MGLGSGTWDMPVAGNHLQYAVIRTFVELSGIILPSGTLYALYRLQVKDDTNSGQWGLRENRRPFSF